MAARKFEKGEFVVEYAGELISMEEAQKREAVYSQDENIGCYMYYFKHKNSQHWYASLITFLNFIIRVIKIRISEAFVFLKI